MSCEQKDVRLLVRDGGGTDSERSVGTDVIANFEMMDVGPLHDRYSYEIEFEREVSRITVTVYESDLYNNEIGDFDVTINGTEDGFDVPTSFIDQERTLEVQVTDVFASTSDNSGSWVEIPTIDEGVETHVRKEGSASITHLTNAHFPLEWKGDDYGQYIRALDEQAATQLARVDYRRPSDTDSDEWITTHTGYVRQVGSGGNGRKMRLQIGDISDFLGKIPASQSFNSASIPDVLDYVTGELTGLTLVDNVTYTDVGFDEEIRYLANSFTSNRDTLLDVMNWLVKMIDGYWWVSVTDDATLELTYKVDPMWLSSIGDEGIIDSMFISSFRSDDGQELVEGQLEHGSRREDLRDGASFERVSFTETNLYAEENDVSYDRAAEERTNVIVLENQALYQLQPINTVTVYGDSPRSVNTPAGNINLEYFWTDVSSQQYPVGIATYDPLAERSETPLEPPIIESDVSTIEGAKREAKQELVERLNESQGGEMTLLGNPLVSPYDIVEARPACHGRTNVETNPIRYEVESVHHSCPAGERYHTDVDVGMYVDPDEISTEDTMKEE